MWMGLVLTYVAGLFGTAVFLFKDQPDRQNLVWNAAFAFLWPAYWSYVVVFQFLNRKGGKTG